MTRALLLLLVASATSAAAQVTGLAGTLVVTNKTPSTATIIGAHAQLCAMSIYLSGNDDQKDRYLTALCEGRKLGAWALTTFGLVRALPGILSSRPAE